MKSNFPFFVSYCHDKQTWYASVNPGLLVLAISRNFINLVMTAIFLNEI
jgi:hypothetical protein